MIDRFIKNPLAFVVLLAVALAVGIYGSFHLVGTTIPENAPREFITAMSVSVALIPVAITGITLWQITKMYPHKQRPDDFSRVTILYLILSGAGFFAAGSQLAIGQLQGVGVLIVGGGLLYNRLGGKKGSK